MDDHRDVTDLVGVLDRRVLKLQASRVNDRVLYLSDKPSTAAKNRFNLPAEIPLNWADFASALKI